MNWLDWILLVVIAGSIIASFRKGFSRELIGLISMVVALFCGLWFYGSAGRVSNAVCQLEGDRLSLRLPDRLYRAS